MVLISQISSTVGERLAVVLLFLKSYKMIKLLISKYFFVFLLKSRERQVLQITPPQQVSLNNLLLVLKRSIES